MMRELSHRTGFRGKPEILESLGEREFVGFLLDWIGLVECRDEGGVSKLGVF